MPFECHLEDFFWRSICQVGGWLVCFGMLPDYAPSALCKFYCNGCYPFAPAVFSLCNFSPVCCASLIEKCTHPACALLKVGRLLFLAHKAGCKPDVLESGFVLLCVGPSSSLINVAMQAGSDTFVIASLIRVPCKNDPAVHFCQLKVGDDLCQMFGWRAKCK